MYGRAPHPVSCGRELVIGDGYVYPEINFTLPSISVEEGTWGQVREQYTEIIEEVLQRAVELEVPGLMVEFELLPPMTFRPEWGAEITGLLVKYLDQYFERHELRSALRVTPVDVRENSKPPKLRSGEYYEKTIETLEQCAAAGADLLSIESTGGKEIHDEALMNADIEGIAFALGVLGVRDMKFLWEKIVDIAEKYHCVPAGDTACGFANTAMILADQRMIPKLLAAVDRVATVPRTLQAHLSGATGPSKDCAYEGPYLKAIRGIPISMEGKSSACAHLSSVGNIAAACTDLWSNESVQNVRLLSTIAPVVSLEHLAYDCRLMNTAVDEGATDVRNLQHLLVKSDRGTDPQAFVLAPDIVLRISEALIQAQSLYEMTVIAIRESLTVLEEALTSNSVKIRRQERRWIELMGAQAESLPDDERDLYQRMRGKPYYQNMQPEAYGLEE